jgi:hypothetical protein
MPLVPEVGVETHTPSRASVFETDDGASAGVPRVVIRAPIKVSPARNVHRVLRRVIGLAVSQACQVRELFHV